jgi:dipeptidase D
MKHLTITLITLSLVVLLVGACIPVPAPATPSPEPQPSPAAIANPASENCLKQGGTLSIEQRGDGGQYGICFFEDNRQCEEWALLRGDCPVGGRKVTGYVTPAARYCAITGGTYAVTGNSNTDNEQGTCTFKNGTRCDVWDYFNGKCSPSTAPAASPGVLAARVPLKDAVKDLEPRDVWQDFYSLTQVPRPSHHEEKVRDFLVQFGQGLGLETLVDDAGNVIIRKPAAKGMENRQGVILQAHMDMVPQKTPDKVFDFTKDPIEAYVEGGWVKANGTTLGADDGSGIAIAMAVLQSQTPLGPIEALFTVNEEDGMDGALGLKPGLLKGDILINLDSETEGIFTIGSAGGEDADIQATYPEVAVPAGMAAYRVSVSGLKGGHSGVDINLGRGHATKLLVRLLQETSAKYGLRLAQIAGGSAANAIPREATALVVVPQAQAGEFLPYVQKFEGIVKNELAAVEPDLRVQATLADLPAKVMEEKAQRTLLDALYATPQGVLRMSDAVPGLVETSTNIGIVTGGDGKLEVLCFMRSSVDTALDDVGQMIVSVWDLAGMKVTLSGRFAGWRPNANSPILGLMSSVYKELFDQEARVVALHAGLECGAISAKYPRMDAISIGPTLQDVHTPAEGLEIASVKKLYDFLLATLQRIPARGP